MNPRVSVVTSVYNGEAYVDRALPSIQSQAFDAFEYIIVDDGSTDHTPAILEEWAAQDARIRVLSPGRLGFAKALNYGIARARGEYIARQDFDDVSYPDRLALQAEYLDTNPGTALVGGYYVLVDENRGERYVRMPPLEHEKIIRAMPKYIPFAHTIVMFRKSAWAEAGGYPEVTDIEDLRLWISFARMKWRLATIPHVLGEHWVHENSFWHRNFGYRERQTALRRIQHQAVRELNLPGWMHIYPIARHLYWLVPPGIKRFMRRSLAGSGERDTVVPGSPIRAGEAFVGSIQRSEAGTESGPTVGRSNT